jgi:hypothetical protein
VIAGRRALATLLVAVMLAPGCATTGGGSDPVLGRPVTLVTEPESPKVKGELLLVEKDRLYVRAEDGVREVPLRSVREARVRRQGPGKSRAFAWALIGGLITGGALAAACSSVEDASGCGGVGLGTLGAWMLIGALSAPSFEAANRVVLPRPTPEQLRAYARLPQGLPAGVTPAALGPAPTGPPGDGKEK